MKRSFFRTHSLELHLCHAGGPGCRGLQRSWHHFDTSAQGIWGTFEQNLKIPLVPCGHGIVQNWKLKCNFSSLEASFGPAERMNKNQGNGTERFAPGLLEALSLWDGTWPTFAAEMRLELWKMPEVPGNEWSFSISGSWESHLKNYRCFRHFYESIWKIMKKEILYYLIIYICARLD